MPPNITPPAGGQDNSQHSSAEEQWAQLKKVSESIAGKSYYSNEDLYAVEEFNDLVSQARKSGKIPGKEIDSFIKEIRHTLNPEIESSEKYSENLKAEQDIYNGLPWYKKLTASRPPKDEEISSVKESANNLRKIQSGIGVSGIERLEFQGEVLTNMRHSGDKDFAAKFGANFYVTLNEVASLPGDLYVTQRNKIVDDTVAGMDQISKKYGDLARGTQYAYDNRGWPDRITDALSSEENTLAKAARERSGYAETVDNMARTIFTRQVQIKLSNAKKTTDAEPAQERGNSVKEAIVSDEALKPIIDSGEKLISKYKALVEKETNKTREAFENAKNKFNESVKVYVDALTPEKDSFVPPKSAVLKVEKIVNEVSEELRSAIPEKTSGWSRLTYNNKNVRDLGEKAANNVNSSFDRLIQRVDEKAVILENAALLPRRKYIKEMATKADSTMQGVYAAAENLASSDIRYSYEYGPGAVSHERLLFKALDQLQSAGVTITYQDLLISLIPPNDQNIKNVMGDYSIKGPEKEEAFQRVVQAFSGLYREADNKLFHQYPVVTEDHKREVLKVFFISREESNRTPDINQGKSPVLGQHNELERPQGSADSIEILKAAAKAFVQSLCSPVVQNGDGNTLTDSGLNKAALAKQKQQGQQ